MSRGFDLCTGRSIFPQLLKTWGRKPAPSITTSSIHRGNLVLIRGTPTNLLGEFVKTLFKKLSLDFTIKNYSLELLNFNTIFSSFFIYRGKLKSHDILPLQRGAV